MQDLNQIGVFVSVVESGSFTKAAQTLEMPKSTVSRKVSELEAHLGVTLLHRTTRKLTLTELGAAYFERCRHAIRETRIAEQAVHDAQGVPRGTLRVTGPPGMSFLGEYVARFMCQHPEVTAELDLSQRRVDVLSEGYDVAIRPGPLVDHATLKARKLGEIASVIVASADYLKRRGVPQTLDDLLDHDCIRFETSQGPLPWRFIVDGKERGVHVSGRLVANDMLAVASAATHGAGIAVLPITVLQAADGALQRVLPDVQTEAAPLHAIFSAARYLSPRIRAFVDFLSAELTPHLPTLLSSRLK